MYCSLKRVVGVLLSMLLHTDVAADNWLPERELVLLSDASPSMYHRSNHHQLQRNGYANALEDPAVVEALLQVPTVVRVVFYAGSVDVAMSFPPVAIQSRADVTKLVRLIRQRSPTSSLSGGTNQCQAVVDAQQLPRSAPVRIYDLVSDESLRGKEKCQVARRQAEAMGDTINVLGIGSAATSTSPATYYTHVITTQPVGFFMEATGWDDFATAIKRKLLRELLIM